MESGTATGECERAPSVVLPLASRGAVSSGVCTTAAILRESAGLCGSFGLEYLNWSPFCR